MKRNLRCFAALSFGALVACGQQEPAVAPLAPPPAAAALPTAPPVEAKKDAPKPVPLTAEQKAKLYQEAWAAFNAKDFTQFKALYAESATSEQLDMGPPAVGANAVVEGGKAFTGGFPDGTGEIQLTLINGNNIVGVVLMRGTQTGTFVTPMGPVPATGKKVGYLLTQSLELNDEGKIVKEVMASDGGTVAGQLGLMPIPHRKLVETGWAEKPVVIASGSEVEKSNLAAMTKELEAFNKHDAAGTLGTADDKIVFSELSAPADRIGKKESIKGVEDMWKAFPDAKLNVKSAWAAGDYVVATGTWTGTNTGDSPAMKLKKTGKSVSIGFVQIDQFAGGKTSHVWVFSNGAAAAAQLGLMPPKGAQPTGKEAKPSAAKPATPAVAPTAKKAQPALNAPAAAAPITKPPTK